ncbi:unnamed protein product [Sphagnum balticum]
MELLLKRAEVGEQRALVELKEGRFDYKEIELRREMKGFREGEGEWRTGEEILKSSEPSYSSQRELEGAIK